MYLYRFNWNWQKNLTFYKYMLALEINQFRKFQCKDFWGSIFSILLNIFINKPPTVTHRSAQDLNLKHQL